MYLICKAGNVSTTIIEEENFSTTILGIPFF